MGWGTQQASQLVFVGLKGRVLKEEIKCPIKLCNICSGLFHAMLVFIVKSSVAGKNILYHTLKCS